MTDWQKITALLTLLFTSMATAMAAEITRGETVTTRPRPDYDAVGTRLGGFTLYPEATLEFMYDDNILAADRDEPEFELDDMLVTLAPAIALRSDWSKHALNTGARVSAGRYTEYVSQDFTDYELWADGNLEFGRSLLGARISHSHLHQLRTSANDTAANERPIFPIEFDMDNVAFIYRYAPNRFYARGSLEFTNYDFEDSLDLRITPPPPVAVIRDNDDRDRLVTDARLRGGYLISPSYSMFLEGRLYDFDYDQEEDRFGVQRDSDGYDILAGSEFDLSGVTSGEVFVGYRNIEYVDPLYETQNGPIFGANVDWNITQLTTITFLGSQRLYGTVVFVDGVPASGIEAAELGVVANHELRRNIILNLELRGSNEEFLQTTREDDVARFRIGGEYLLNRNWRLNAGYTYQKRDSNDNNAREFRVNQIFLGILGQI
jgi:hypothetical protein